MVRVVEGTEKSLTARGERGEEGESLPGGKEMVRETNGEEEGIEA